MDLPSDARRQPDRLPFAGIAPMLQQGVDQQLMAGAVTLVWRRGELAHAGAVGWRDVAARDPMRPDALFRIASMTKPIVSLAVMMLAEEGRLRLDDPVSRWIPELGDMQVLIDPLGPLDAVRPSSRAITIEDLLTHRSGLATAYTASGPLGAAYAERLGMALLDPRGPDMWLAALGDLPLIAEPGERFTYSAGIDVLGCLLARVEGRALSEIVQRRIFDPLGMVDTGFWVPADKRDRLALLYRACPEGGALQDISLPLSDGPPLFESGSGGLFSTAPDYLRFARLLLRRGEVDGVRLVRPETVDLMARNRLTPAQRAMPFPAVAGAWSSWGFGLGLSMMLDPDRSPVPGSVGSYTWPGAFGSWWRVDPARELVLVYMMQDYMPLSSDRLGDVAETPRADGRVTARQLLGRFQRQAYASVDG